MMKICNPYTNTDGYCNTYITYTLTGKAAVATDGTIAYTALKTSLCKFLPLRTKTAQQHDYFLICSSAKLIKLV